MLDAYLFEDIYQVGDLSDRWKEDYNEKHPHGSLGGKSPRKYLRTEITKNSNLSLGNMSKISLSKKGKASPRFKEFREALGI